jgi:hypothetical protein
LLILYLLEENIFIKVLKVSSGELKINREYCLRDVEAIIAKRYLFSFKIEGINPSNGRTSELSKKYLVDIKAESDNCIAL